MRQLKIFGISVAIFFMLSIGFGVFVYFYWVEPYLPDRNEIRDISLSEPMKIYTREGLIISQIGEKKRYIVEYESIPQALIDSLLVIEDKHFYDHFGIDIKGLLRAAIAWVRTGERSQGGSTLTMQLARNLFLTREKSFLRKFREIFLALRLERVYSKNEILTLYVNRVFLGHRSYGFQAAAQTYFGKPLPLLSLAETALLAGLPKAPSTFNPLSNAKRSKVRRDYILLRLYQQGLIDENAYKLAVSEPIKPKKHGAFVDINAGHVADMAQREAVTILRQQGITQGLYEKGFKIFTTIASTQQKTAYAAVQQGVLDYSRRHQWGGVEKQIKIKIDDGKPWKTWSIQRKKKWLEAEEKQNYLISLTQQITFIDGLLRGVIYHSKGNQVWVMLENGQTIKLAKKDVFWAQDTWTKETSKDYKLKQLSQKIQEDIDTLLEEESAEVYFHPHLDLAIKRHRQKRPLPLGGLLYVQRRIQAKPPPSTTNKTLSVLYRLYGKPKVQAALVSIDVRTGAILSLVGGFNYHNYKFNRATQSRRQLGSNFKPFLYASALHKGMTAATIVDDIPISFEDKRTGFIWTPHNYSGKYFGATRLRDALTYSRNLVSIKLMTEIGINNTIKYMSRFGFKKAPFNRHRNLSISLGSVPFSPLEVVRGYAVFANGGYLVKPYLISEIQDDAGNVLYRYTPPTICYHDCVVKTSGLVAQVADQTVQNNTVSTIYRAQQDQGLSSTWTTMTTAFRVIDADVSYIITDILQDVIKRGTGRRAKVLKRPDLAGKTGTTNEYYDAWFSGYNHSIATTVWVGYDNPQSMGDKETGGRAALPIWISYMREALKGTPVIKLPRSSNLVEMRISKKTGKAVLGFSNEPTMLELFRSQYIPSTQPQNRRQSIHSNERDNQNQNDRSKNNDLLKKLF